MKISNIVEKCLGGIRKIMYAIIRKPLLIYGIALLPHILLLALHTASKNKLGYFVVVRRVSIYSIIQSNHLINTALFSTSFALFSITIAISLGKERTRNKALLLITPLLTPLVFLGNELVAISCLSIMLGMGVFLSLSIKEIYRGLLVALTTLVLVSIVELVSAAMGLDTPGSSRLILDIYGLMQPISPYLYLAVLIFSITILILFLVKRSRRNIGQDVKNTDTGIGEYYYPVLGSILALIMYMIPYTIIINPRRMIATTDIVVYVELLEQMNKFENPLTAALKLRQGDRFLYMLLLYYLQKALGLDPWAISTISGWLWTPLLVFSSWYMARKLHGDKVARHVALITPLSTQILGFIYGGFQANQLNIALLLLSMGLLAENKTWKTLLGSITLTLSAGIHLWSWIHIVPAMTLWIIVETTTHRDKKNLVKLGLVIVSISIAVFIANSAGAISHIYRDSLMRIMEKTVNTSLEAKLNGLFKSLAIYVWGSLNNPVLFTTCIGGQALRAHKPGHTPLDYLNTLTLIGIYLLSPDITMVSRLILNTPVHISASIILEKCRRETKIAIYSTLFFNALYMALNAPPK